jgi:hypothetical protein
MRYTVIQGLDKILKKKQKIQIPVPCLSGSSIPKLKKKKKKWISRSKNNTTQSSSKDLMVLSQSPPKAKTRIQKKLSVGNVIPI